MSTSNRVGRRRSERTRCRCGRTSEVPKRPSSRKLGEHPAPRQAGTARWMREVSRGQRHTRAEHRALRRNRGTDRMSKITVREESVMIVAR